MSAGKVAKSPNFSGEIMACACIPQQKVWGGIQLYSIFCGSCQPRFYHRSTPNCGLFADCQFPPNPLPGAVPVGPEKVSGPCQDPLPLAAMDQAAVNASKITDRLVSTIEITRTLLLSWIFDRCSPLSSPKQPPICPRSRDFPRPRFPMRSPDLCHRRGT